MFCAVKDTYINLMLFLLAHILANTHYITDLHICQSQLIFNSAFLLHHYSKKQFPVRQPSSLSNTGADYFEISPRPFTLSPPAPSITGFQYTPRQQQQPAVQQQPQQQRAVSSSYNTYPFGQQPTTTTSVASVFNHPPAPAANTHHQSPQARFPNQPIDGTASNNNNRFGDQASESYSFMS